VVGYHIYREGTEIGTTTSTQYSDSGLAASTEYTYTVAAYDEAGNHSAQSLSASATTGAGPAIPTVSLQANPMTVSGGGNTTLIWNSSNTNTCTAGGGWSGIRSTSGNETIADITTNTTFTLTCTGTGGSANQSVTVTVQPASSDYDGTCETFADVAALPAGHWCEVPNSHMEAKEKPPYEYDDFNSTTGSSEIYDNLQGNSGVAGVMKKWSGAAFDTNAQRLVVWGGGHKGYRGNELYAFDLDTLQWERLTDPSVTVQMCNSGGGINPDGTPGARHTYDALTYIEHQNAFFGVGAAGSCEQGGCFIDHQWLYDFTSGTWIETANLNDIRNRATACNDSALYDPISRLVLFHSNGYWYTYDVDTDLWMSRGRSGVNNAELSAALDPNRSIIVKIGVIPQQGEPDIPIIEVFDLKDLSFDLTNPNTTGSTEIESYKSPGLEYDPVSTHFIAYYGGTDIYSLNPETNVWTKHTAPTSNAANPGPIDAEGGVFGRFAYSATHNVFVFVDATNENVFLYRFADRESVSSN
jgi:chitodextrinase